MSNSVFDKNKLKTNSAIWFLVIGLSEALGTGFLVFFGCLGLVPSIASAPPSHVQTSIVFGMGVAIIVQIFGHVSGSHINPAVTMAALIFKTISPPAAGMYILSQFIGAILGYGALMIMAPTETLYRPNGNMNVTHAFCTTVPNPKITTFQGLFAEFVATSLLIYVCCSVWDKRNATKQDSTSIKFGLTILGLAMAFGPFTGGSMNPARSFAPAVFTGVWDRQWVYWVGPLSAAVITTFFYKFTLGRNLEFSNADISTMPLNQLNSKVQNSEKLSTEDIATI